MEKHADKVSGFVSVDSYSTYTEDNLLRLSHHSYGHLPVISGYKWDYTFYKWGFVSTYN